MSPLSASDLASLKESHPELGAAFWSKFEQGYQEEHQKPVSKLMVLAIVADALHANDKSEALENQCSIHHQHQNVVHENGASRETQRREKPLNKTMRGLKRKTDADEREELMSSAGMPLVGFTANCVCSMEEFDREERLTKEKLQKKPMQVTDSPKKKRQDYFDEGEKLMSSAIMSHPITPYFEYEQDRDSAMDIKEIEEQKKKVNKKGGRGSDANHPPPKLPEEFGKKIMSMSGVADKATLVIEKRLFKSDLLENNNRISMPSGQITELSEFLKEEEINLLENQKEILVTLIHKPVRQPQIIETNINLRQWNMQKETKKNFQYVLKTTWGEVAEQNDLKILDKVQIWAFRGPEDKLCMALVIVERANKNKNQKEWEPHDTKQNQ